MVVFVAQLIVDWSSFDPRSKSAASASSQSHCCLK